MTPECMTVCVPAYGREPVRLCDADEVVCEVERVSMKWRDWWKEADSLMECVYLPSALKGLFSMSKLQSCFDETEWDNPTHRSFNRVLFSLNLKMKWSVYTCMCDNILISVSVCSHSGRSWMCWSRNRWRRVAARPTYGPWGSWLITWPHMALQPPCLSPPPVSTEHLE